jgi:hypothetical protein
MSRRVDEGCIPANSGQRAIMRLMRQPEDSLAKLKRQNVLFTGRV